jgi:hypothetical protein
MCVDAAAAAFIAERKGFTGCEYKQITLCRAHGVVIDVCRHMNGIHQHAVWSQ